MKVSISGPGALLFEPDVFADGDRTFVPVWRAGLPFDFAPEQYSLSTSVLGTVRGVHFAAGQAKMVTCVAGAIWDVAVDLRPGSKTFGQWHATELNDANRHAVFLEPGMGHGFCALSESATVAYLLSPGYDPATEREVHPLDPALGIAWPTSDPRLSARDAGAPLLEAVAR